MLTSSALTSVALGVVLGASAGPAPDGGSSGADAAAPMPDAGTGATRPGRDERWSHMRTPVRGEPRAIGSTSNGCLQGAVALPPSGPGFEVLHIQRGRRYGHPALVAYVRRLGALLKKHRLGSLLVGDLAQPRGGPTLTGHRSHQSGLDADLGYAHPPWVGMRKMSAAEREALFPPAVVDLKTRALTRLWNAKVSRILQLAASDAAVDRIFVNPVIKRELCRTNPTAPWLRPLRPWWGHHDHFHVRLRCPPGDTDCQAQDPLPPGNGCDALAWWFSEDARRTQEDRQQAAVVEAQKPPPLPAACEALVK